MALIPHSSMLFLAAVLVVPVVYGMQPDQGGNDDPQDSLPRYPLRPKRWPGNPWQRAAEPQEESHLEPGMDFWMEYPTVSEIRNPVLMEESLREPYNPSFSEGLHLVGPLGNPYDHAGLVVEPNQQPREQIPLHTSRRLENPYNKENFINSYDIPENKMMLHSLWSHEIPNDQGEIMMDHHDQPVEENFVVNPWTLRRPGFYRYPGSIEVAKNYKDLGTPQPASTDKPIRSVPDRWNEFVINSIVKLKYGGDDVFDISEFSWIPGQDTLSSSMIEDMLRWNQPDGGEILVPKLLQVIGSSVTRFDQGKWKFPGNSLQVYTVPLSIVRLFRDSMKSSHVQTEPILKEPREDLSYDWEKSQVKRVEDRGHLHNRHAVDFRDYHDFDFVPKKELPQKDPVLLGQEDT